MSTSELNNVQEDDEVLIYIKNDILNWKHKNNNPNTNCFEKFIAIYDKHRSKIPFDVMQFAKELEIEVYLSKEMEKDESGAILFEPPFTYKVYINSGLSPQRRIFTLAHELCHYFFDRDYLEIKGQILEADHQRPKMYRASKPMPDPDLVWRDIRANKFAAEILMPRDKFKAVWEDSSSPEEVAKCFDVSISAVKIRASDLLGVVP